MDYAENEQGGQHLVAKVLNQQRRKISMDRIQKKKRCEWCFILKMGRHEMMVLGPDLLFRSWTETDREHCQGYPEMSIGLILALYVTFGYENFVKGPANLFTQALADLRLAALHPDRYDVWSFGRSARAIALPRATSGNESWVQRAVGNRLAQEDEGLENSLAPISPASEQEYHRRR